MLAWLWTCVGEIPRRPIDEANGAYRNPCCVPVVLRSGTLQVDKRYVSYVIEEDKRGRYVLPGQSIDVRSNGTIAVGDRKYPLKMYLGDGNPPSTIEILSNNAVYVFDHQN